MENEVTDDIGRAGWTIRGYESYNFTGAPAIVKNLPNASWCPVLEVSTTNSAVITGTYKPSRKGSHYLGFSGIGPSQLYINGKLVFEQKDSIADPMSFLLGTSSEQPFQLHFDEGSSYRIEIRTVRVRKNGGMSILSSLIGFHLGLLVDFEHDEDLLASAVAAAKQAEVAIIFTGHTTEWESEGQDQRSFNLPADGSQDRLISAVSKVNSKVIIVNLTGTPIAMPWVDQVAAIVQSWFPGQEAGNSVADVLTGVANPSGRLPVTFPRTIEDAPAFGNFPGLVRNGRREVHYAEDVFVGYRHYDQEDRKKVLFPFGFGLSYTTFQISDFKVRDCGDCTYEAHVKVTNTGSMGGSHVVQIYVGPAVTAQVARPIKQLAGFKKVLLKPNETVEAEISIPIESLAYFDETRELWVVESGDYYVFAASSAMDVHDQWIIAVRDGLTYAP
jgi:beta-glucosidase